MKRFIKLACLLMTLTILLGALGACSPGGEKSENELLIGGIGPLTGDYANYGTSVEKGAKLAVEEINAKNGANGFKLVLDFQDSKGVPDSAVTAYGQLMDKGMKVSLGTVLSGEMASVSAAAKNDGILMLSPSASAKDAIAGNDAAFRVCFNDPQQGTVSADFIAANGLASKVAVFYQSDLDYSTGLYEAFKAQCAVKNLEIVTTTTYTDATKTDFSAQISAIKNSGAKLVFMPIYAAEAATFLTQAYGKIADVSYFGCDGMEGILKKISDPKYAEGVMMLTPFSTDDTAENVKSFVTAFKNKYSNEVPDQFAADGYDAIYAIADALKQAAVTPDNMDEATFNSKMVAAMTKISVNGVTGKMSWTADGESAKEAKVITVKNGVYTMFVKE